MTSIASPAAVEQLVRSFAGSPAASGNITYIKVKAAVIDRFGVPSFAKHKNLVQSLLASLAAESPPSLAWKMLGEAGVARTRQPEESAASLSQVAREGGRSAESLAGGADGQADPPPAAAAAATYTSSGLMGLWSTRVVLPLDVRDPYGPQTTVEALVVYRSGGGCGGGGANTTPPGGRNGGHTRPTTTGRIEGVFRGAELDALRSELLLSGATATAPTEEGGGSGAGSSMRSSRGEGGKNRRNGRTTGVVDIPGIGAVVVENVGGLVVMPGVVDCNVAMAPAGIASRLVRDRASASKAAAAGGVTFVCDMPIHVDGVVGVGAMGSSSSSSSSCAGGEDYERRRGDGGRGDGSAEGGEDGEDGEGYDDRGTLGIGGDGTPLSQPPFRRGAGGEMVSLTVSDAAAFTDRIDMIQSTYDNWVDWGAHAVFTRDLYRQEDELRALIRAGPLGLVATVSTALSESIPDVGEKELQWLCRTLIANGSGDGASRKSRASSMSLTPPTSTPARSSSLSPPSGSSLSPGSSWGGRRDGGVRRKRSNGGNSGRSNSSSSSARTTHGARTIPLFLHAEQTNDKELSLQSPLRRMHHSARLDPSNEIHLPITLGRKDDDSTSDVNNSFIMGLDSMGGGGQRRRVGPSEQ
jgi:hypothetical protein